MEKYELIIGSPVDYDEIVIYIKFNNEYVALIQKEEGINQIKIEFFNEKIRTGINFDIFIEALLKAKDELLK